MADAASLSLFVRLGGVLQSRLEHCEYGYSFHQHVEAGPFAPGIADFRSQAAPMTPVQDCWADLTCSGKSTPFTERRQLFPRETIALFRKAAVLDRWR